MEHGYLNLCFLWKAQMLGSCWNSTANRYAADDRFVGSRKMIQTDLLLTQASFDMIRILLTRAATLFVLNAVFSFSIAHAEPICTVVSDAATGKLLKQEGACKERLTPASTFKIALSLMGFDCGYLTSEHLPALPFDEGYPAWIESWKASTDPAGWMKNSVVWFSWQITEWLGEERFKRYVTGFHYGNEDVSGDPGKNDGLTDA